jgi:hypothetical protein
VITLLVVVVACWFALFTDQPATACLIAVTLLANGVRVGSKSKGEPD